MIVTLKQKEHDLYTRRGNDLYATVAISPEEALVGFSKTLKHLDGHDVKVMHDGTTKPKLVMTLKGEGMPVHKPPRKIPSNFGDLHVTIVVKKQFTGHFK